MDEPALVENRTFDEIQPGESASLERTVTRRDIELYAAVSGDANPTHLDEAFARQAKMPGVVAHGMLTAGLISSLLGNRLPGAGTVYVAQDLRFAAPVHAGDHIRVTITVREKQAQGRLVIFDCDCTNQDGVAVLTGTATVVAPTEKRRGPAVELARLHYQDHDHYEALIARDKEIPAIPAPWRIPCDASSLQGAVDAALEGIIVPILVGPAAKIQAVAKEQGLDISGYEIVDVPHSHAAAAKAVELVRSGKAQLLMKGSLHTDELMGEVVAKETGLRTGRRISHVFLMDVPTYPFPLFITDAAINIVPDLTTKIDIVQNAIDLHVGLGLGEPRVAILAAVETVNPKMPSTLDAAALCKMADRGQIKGGVLDGPLALDNAISPEAVRIKGIVSPVAGQAQILVVPDLEAGNMLAKNLSFMADADAAGIVLGAKVPIILTSRADNVRTRMASCAVAALYAHNRQAAAMSRGETLLVVNAGSSSIKFQLFRVGDAQRLELAFKGQMEGIGTQPHLIAKDGAGATLIDERYQPAQVGDTASALDQLGDWLVGQLGGGLAAGGRSPRRAWRPGLQRADLDRRRRARGAGSPGAAGAAAPAEQSGADSRDPPALPADSPGRLLRHGVPPRPSRGRRSVCHRRTAGTRRACAATAFTACPTSISRAGCASSTRRWRRAGWWSATWAPVPRCARSGTGGAWTARWASPPSTACRWAPAPASSTPA